jgi:hypothetical protein
VGAFLWTDTSEKVNAAQFSNGISTPSGLIHCVQDALAASFLLARPRAKNGAHPWLAVECCGRDRARTKGLKVIAPAEIPCFVVAAGADIL